MLGRFTQADTIVPAGVQGYDRYAFVNNNPVRYTDPSGHAAWQGDDGGLGENDDGCGIFGCHTQDIPDYVENAKLSGEDTQSNVNQCMLTCHKAVDPQAYYVIDFVDGLHVFSNTLGLVGDIITIGLFFITPGPDELAAATVFTAANSANKGITGAGLIIDAYDIYKQGSSATKGLVIDGSLAAFSVKKALEKVPALKTIVPGFSLPYHIIGLGKALAPSFDIVTVGGNQ